MSLEKVRAIGDIATERDRQRKLGISSQNDDQKDRGQLARMAATYAHASTLEHPERTWVQSSLLHATERDDGTVNLNVLRLLWPAMPSRIQPHFNRSKRDMLVIAGALIVAEIERLDRQKERFDQMDRDAPLGARRVDPRFVSFENDLEKLSGIRIKK